jgi:diacylglycerol kinase (ATP)
LNLVFQGVGAGMADDPRVLHFKVRKIVIDTHPVMQAMTDGNPLGEGAVRIEVRKHALAVMVGSPGFETEPGPEKTQEQQNP